MRGEVTATLRNLTDHARSSRRDVDSELLQLHRATEVNRDLGRRILATRPFQRAVHLHLFIKRGQRARERPGRRSAAAIVVHGDDALIATWSTDVRVLDSLDRLAVHVAVDLDRAETAEVSAADGIQEDDDEGQPQGNSLWD